MSGNGHIGPVRLCDQCKPLQLDESRLVPPELTGPPDESTIKIPVAFERRDTFPNLPIMESAGQNGCEFCKMLRQAILQKYGKELVELSTSHSLNGPRWLLVHRLTYMGDLVEPRDTLDWHFSLVSLRAEIDHAGRSTFKRFVGFNIYSDRGEFRGSDLAINH